MALTPEQFRALEAMRLRSGQDTFYDPTSGYQMLAMRGDNQSNGTMVNGEWTPDPITGYRATQGVAGNGQDRTWLNGRNYDNLGLDGAKTGEGMWQGLTPDGAGDDFKQILKAAAVMAAVAGGGSFLQGLGGAGGAAGAGSGAAAGGGGFSFGITPTAAELAAGVHIPGSYLSGAAAAGAAGGALGAGGTGASLGGASGGLGAAAPAAGGLGGAGGAAGGAGGLGSLGSLGGMLGPAATAIGGLLGSQGNKAESSSSRLMDPRLDPYAYGAPGQRGIFQDAQALKDQQMDPTRQQQWIDMQNTGRGLLGNPIAGNGTSKFAARRLY